jgi:hypothetical protein
MGKRALFMGKELKQGWQARIMTKADAVLHPRFKEIQEMLLKLPTVNVVEYEQSCYLRWVAAIATGCRVTHPSFDPYSHGILRCFNLFYTTICSGCLTLIR